MLGIIGAMDEEVAKLKETMQDVTVETKASMEFYKGTMNGKEVVVVRSGIGKVNAGICTQILCDLYHVDAVINTGIAGSLNAKIDIGDIVLSTDALQHDMDATGFVDAPSGTALALADAINDARDNAYEYVYDRSQVRKKRDKKELGISAVRGGTIVGEHEVIFAGVDEVIEFKHTAYSKSVFAKGAVEAAKFLAGKPAGFYDMADVIG